MHCFTEELLTKINMQERTLVFKHGLTSAVKGKDSLAVWQFSPTWQMSLEQLGGTESHT